MLGIKNKKFYTKTKSLKFANKTKNNNISRTKILEKINLDNILHTQGNISEHSFKFSRAFFKGDFHNIKYLLQLFF